MTDNEIIKSYEKEIRRLRISNLRYKLHMQVLAGSPNSKTAKKVLQDATESIFNDFTVTIN